MSRKIKNYSELNTRDLALLELEPEEYLEKLLDSRDYMADALVDILEAGYPEELVVVILNTRYNRVGSYTMDDWLSDFNIKTV